MVQRITCAAGLTALLALFWGIAPASATPVKLARHPDYNAGTITFSYLGDIWTANEDGTNVHRLTDNRSNRSADQSALIAFRGSIRAARLAGR